MTPRPSEQKFQIFQDSIVSQFPEETWAQKKNKPNIEIWPESLGVMLEFQYTEHVACVAGAGK